MPSPNPRWVPWMGDRFHSKTEWKLRGRGGFREVMKRTNSSFEPKSIRGFVFFSSPNVEKAGR